MILFKKWAKHKVKWYISCVNQFLCNRHHKKWNQECKQKQSLLFNIWNIFYLLTSRTFSIFKPDFYIFSYKKQLRKILRNFNDKFLLYHTSLIGLNLAILSLFEKRACAHLNILQNLLHLHQFSPFLHNENSQRHTMEKGMIKLS